MIGAVIIAHRFQCIKTMMSCNSYWSRVFLVILGILSMPFFARAISTAEIQQQGNALLEQVAQLQNHIATLSAVPPEQSSTGLATCPALRSTLVRGVRGAEVTGLQMFLAGRGYLAPDAATGYFGALTEAALQKWQADAQIVSSGSPATTGWGTVGMRTRAAIAALCREKPLPRQCPAAPAGQVRSCSSGQVLEFDSSCAQVCRTLPAALRIASTVGPTTLAVGERGTWSVLATDVSTSSLKYSVTWGDELSAPINGVYTYTGPLPSFATSSTFSHVYARPGTYAVILSARNGSGTVVRSTLPVRVIDDSEGPQIRMLLPILGTDVPGGLGPRQPGGDLTVRWEVSKAPQNSVLQLWLFNQFGRNLGMMQSIGSFGGDKTAVTGTVDNGKFVWRVPGPACDAQNRCEPRPSGCVPFGLYGGTYYIVAKLYQPIVGGMQTPVDSCYEAPSYMAIASSSSFTIASSSPR